ncbi:STM3941 family protein [Alkalihalobacillus sp. LMS39]|uniref:STM3941 family protein n=1 Tax=Alkalihalobacillus sp. LMS39 TaxID=2924032 RepID=UPI001FB49633|nr:STM3941 family protein [Alkalihalobacillus sp. LMS39]UOE96209.1 hypothetical protein MM271_11655 [Alkalihalobacillus sp. LMS39]
MKEYRIERSKKKMIGAIVLLLLFGLPFSLLGVYLLLDEGFSFISLLFIALGVVLLSFMIYAIRKVKENSPDVIISKRGIYLDMFTVWIRWEDIEGILPYQLQGQTFFGVIVKEEEKYISPLKASKRNLIRINQKMGFPGFNISLTYIKHKEHLFEALDAYNVPILEVVS